MACNIYCITIRHTVVIEDRRLLLTTDDVLNSMCHNGHLSPRARQRNFVKLPQISKRRGKVCECIFVHFALITHFADVHFPNRPVLVRFYTQMDSVPMTIL